VYTEHSSPDLYEEIQGFVPHKTNSRATHSIAPTISKFLTHSKQQNHAFSVYSASMLSYIFQGLVYSY